MSLRWFAIIVFLGYLASGNFALGEDDLSRALQDLPNTEQIQINAINGQPIQNHPEIINVLPGERISFKADIFKPGPPCTVPGGCPEKRSAEEFIWSADDRVGDECQIRHPHACLTRSSFERDEDDMIFHIPPVMEKNIMIRVTHETLSSQDQIILHNGGSTYVAEHPSGDSVDERAEPPHYPTFNSWQSDDPYWGPNYPCYYYSWGPYPYYRDWGPWGCSSVPIGYGWYFWGTWGWPYGYWGWYHPYYPGYYGYYHPGWWRSGYALSNRPFGFAGPERRMMSGGYEQHPGGGYENRSGNFGGYGGGGYGGFGRGGGGRR
jgi:hypothetical protein